MLTHVARHVAKQHRTVSAMDPMNMRLLAKPSFGIDPTTGLTSLIERQRKTTEASDRAVQDARTEQGKLEEEDGSDPVRDTLREERNRVRDKQSKLHNATKALEKADKSLREKRAQLETVRASRRSSLWSITTSSTCSIEQGPINSLPVGPMTRR